jgi:hypothetical protein
MLGRVGFALEGKVLRFFTIARPMSARISTGGAGSDDVLVAKKFGARFKDLYERPTALAQTISLLLDRVRLRRKPEGREFESQRFFRYNLGSTFAYARP